MNNFSGGAKFPRRDSNKPRFGSHEGSRSSMHDATCDECGKPCKVPFLPTTGKPVYCSNCFEKRDTGEGAPRDSRRTSFDKPRFQEKRSFSRPPVLNQESDNKKFDIINAKLDKLIKLLTPAPSETI